MAEETETRLKVVPQEEAVVEQDTPDLEAQIKELHERVARLESVAHNEHSLPPQTIEHIIQQALLRNHAHLTKSLALGKVLLEEQP